MSDLSSRQAELCGTPPGQDFSGLDAVFINCSLKRSPETSNTAAIMDIPATVMRVNGVSVTELRAVEHDIPPGIYPDMREHGYDSDAWPKLWEEIIRPADILVIGTPIWLGQMSSECKKIIERLYGESGKQNDKGQFVFYGKTAGCIVSGNEDGMKHNAMEVLYSLQ